MPGKKDKIKMPIQKPQISNVSDVDMCLGTQEEKVSSPNPNIPCISGSPVPTTKEVY